METIEGRKNKGTKDDGNHKRRRGGGQTGKLRNKGVNRGR